nr:hypothetical protein mv_R1077 [Moumouvirus Monve]
MVKYLIEIGFDISLCNEETYIDVLLNGNPEIEKYLMENGIDICSIKNNIYKNHIVFIQPSYYEYLKNLTKNK